MLDKKRIINALETSTDELSEVLKDNQISTSVKALITRPQELLLDLLYDLKQ